MDVSVQLFLANVWFGLLGLMLALYVVLDGFTLGVGILSLFARDRKRLELMMTSLGSVWDANETWLVVFGGALFGAFPVGYGVVLHGLYIPVMIIIFALLFRGIAFEYRVEGRNKRAWYLSFGIGSTVVAAAQGFALGALLKGIPVVNNAFAGGVWHWLSPFTALTAFGVVSGYALLGASWLVLKTEGALQDWSRRWAKVCGWLTVLAGVGVSLWTPINLGYVSTRWFNWPNALYLAPLPIAAAAAFFMLLRSLKKHYEIAPFLWSVTIFVMSFFGLLASTYPYLIPPSISVYDASSSGMTLAFMLTGIGPLIPIMIVYNAYQYLVFRGKVRPGDGAGSDY